LRLALLYWDIEELLVAHVGVQRQVQRFTPSLIDATRPMRLIGPVGSAAGMVGWGCRG